MSNSKHTSSYDEVCFLLGVLCAIINIIFDIIEQSCVSKIKTEHIKSISEDEYEQ